MSFEENGKRLDDLLLHVSDLTTGVGNLISQVLRLEGRVAELEAGTGDSPPAPEQGNYIWLSPAEIAAIPTSGPAWEKLMEWANSEESVDLWNRTGNADAIVMACAVVYARTGDTEYLNKVLIYIYDALGTSFNDSAAHVLPLSRNLAAYVVAAELVGLPETDPTLNAALIGFLHEALDTEISGRSGHHTLRVSAMRDPTNHGTHARPCVYVVARYLGDEALADEMIALHWDWASGDNSEEFDWHDDRWWQADPDNPVAINPVGAVIEGHDVSGALPEEFRREGSGFMWPPGQPSYPWEALQGAFLMSWLLYRAGYLDVWEWGDQALLRAVQFNYEQADLPASGDDLSLVYLINQAYNTNYPTTEGTDYGKSGLGLWELLFSQ